ncbi:NIPA-like protein 3 [Phytophthora pseudosyringae]|uniref:NIPA-like protein 3 n=1 Tax=Phytophthora pseudosyringae TaxID=221518 RepID=A0A8T1W400_9STRA|nr:NIPA-like protein 3 [Phytophthora pseudosyringae]
MTSQLWVIGVSLSLTATLFGTLGKVLLKLAHTSSQALSVKAAATVCVFLLNPVFDALSYAYAAQSILAPMAGFSVVWNIVLSPYLLNEKVSTHDVRGSAVILLGCMLVGISGSHVTPTHHSAELFALFQSRIFIEYAIFAVCTAVVLVWMICSYDKKSGWRRFAFGALSGLIGGNLFFLKASVELFAEGGAVWSNPETYVIVASALSTAGGGIYVLDLGLREYDALYLVAIYQAFLILIGSVSGVIFFHEISGMNSWWQLVIYPFSIVTTVGGIIVLSEKHTEHCDPVFPNGAINGAKQGEISPLIISQNGAKNGFKHGSIEVV